MAEEVVTGLRGVLGSPHSIEVVEWVPSGGGIFDIYADGERIFSKRETHRFPQPGEIEGLLRRKAVRD